jgi:tRNA-2-methylthio-N6-dimethylallyladenosine synthase
VNEARRLVAQGVREITLLGQNVNAYHGATADGGAWGLGRLIRQLAEIDGLWRIRYTTSHPRDMNDELMSAHRDVPQLMPFLHLPVQSGSDRILQSMNRGHGADDYRRIVERLRAYRPDLALSSDFIVGYPGESDADFKATMTLVAEIGYAQAFSFKYSRRPGTPAAALAHQVPEDVKAERLEALQEVLEAQQQAFNHACVGKMLDVLWVDRGRHGGQITGRSPYLQPVHISAAPELLGRVTTVRLTGLATYSFAAEAVDAQAA